MATITPSGQSALHGATITFSGVGYDLAGASLSAEVDLGTPSRNGNNFDVVMPGTDGTGHISIYQFTYFDPYGDWFTKNLAGNIVTTSTSFRTLDLRNNGWTGANGGVKFKIGHRPALYYIGHVDFFGDNVHQDIWLQHGQFFDFAAGTSSATNQYVVGDEVDVRLESDNKIRCYVNGALCFTSTTVFTTDWTYTWRIYNGDNGGVNIAPIGTVLYHPRYYGTLNSNTAGNSYKEATETYYSVTTLPDTTPPTDAVLGVPTPTGQTSVSVPISTLSADPESAMLKYRFQFDKVSTFDSVDLIDEYYNGTTSPYNKSSGLTLNTLWHTRAKGVNNATPPVQSTNWSNTRTFTTWNAAPTITNATAFTTAELGVAYNQPINTTGGNGNRDVSLFSGALPAGFAITGDAGAGYFVTAANPSALVTNQAFVLRVVDANGQATTKAHTITVSDTTPPAKVVGFTATKITNSRIDVDSDVPADVGGIDHYETQVATNAGFSTAVQNLPHAAKAYSVITGLNPALDTIYHLRQRAFDPSGGVGAYSDPQTVLISVPVVITTAPTLPAGYATVDYTTTIAKTGGSGTGAWSISVQGLQTVAIHPTTGAVSIAAPAEGEIVFTALWTDTNGTTTSKQFTINVNPVAPFEITTASPLTAGNTGAAASQQLETANGIGTGSGDFAVTKGVLPAGKTLSAGGLLAGTPAVANVYHFEVTATRGTEVARKTFTLFVGNGTADFQFYASPATYRAGSAYVPADELYPVVAFANATGAVTLSDNGAGGTFELLGGNTWAYKPANRTRVVTLSATDDTATITRQLTVYGTFPLQPNLGYDTLLDQETKIGRARGGTRYYREDYAMETALTLVCERRDDTERRLLWDFWFAHRKVFTFYYYDVETGMLNLVRFESALTQRLVGACAWTLSCGVRGDFQNNFAAVA